jgi:hypothetical protein
MLDEAWKQYRGWAARARQQQTRTKRWNYVAIIMVVVTAILGTLSSQLHEKSTYLVWITVASALLTAVSGWLGREALAVDGETNWVKARALAEAIKSECFRYAGRSGIYAVEGEEAETAFTDRIVSFKTEILDVRLVPGDPTPPVGGSPPPPSDMTSKWYIENRLGEQRRYFQKTLTRSDKKVFLYRLVALGTMVLGALCSTAAGFTDWPIAAWTGVVTTISAAFIAAGMNERAQAIGAAAARMINQFDDILLKQNRFTTAALVEKTEDALHEENVAWIEIMKKTRAAAAAAAAQEGGGTTPAGNAPPEEPVADGPPDGQAQDGPPAEEPPAEEPPAEEPPK